MAELTIVINGESVSAQEAIRKVNAHLKESGEVTGKMQGVLKNFKENWLGITAAMGGTVIAVRNLWDISKESAKFQQATKAAETQFGQSWDNIQQKLKEASGGTVSDMALIESANRAMALGVTKNLDQMAQLMEIARVRGRALGVDTEKAFSDLVTGIGRGSPLILDNLGIITKGWDEEAKAAGKAMDSQFILNKVLQDGATLLSKSGELVNDSADNMQRFEAEVANAKKGLGDALLPVITSFLEVVVPLVQAFTKLPDGLKATLAIVTALVPAFFALNTALGPIGLAITAITAAVAIGVVKVNAYYKELKALEDFQNLENPTKAFDVLSKKINETKDILERLKESGGFVTEVVNGVAKQSQVTVEKAQSLIDTLLKQIDTGFVQIGTNGITRMAEFGQATNNEIEVLKKYAETLNGIYIEQDVAQKAVVTGQTIRVDDYYNFLWNERNNDLIDFDKNNNDTLNKSKLNDSKKLELQKLYDTKRRAIDVQYEIDYKKNVDTRKALTQAFFNSLDAFNDIGSMSAKKMLAGMVRDFANMVSGQLFALGMSYAARALDPLQTAFMLPAATKAFMESGAVKVFGNVVASEIGAERGANFIVPPGYPHDSYIQPMALTSGERVQVTPADGGGGGGGSTFYITGDVIIRADDPSNFGKLMGAHIYGRG